MIALLCMNDKGRPKEKPEIDELTLGKNPFLNSLEVVVSSVKSDNKYKVHDRHSGDDAIYELASYDYEYTPYCKIFIDSDRRLLISELSPRGKDLFLWIVYEAKRNKDYLWLNKKRYMKESRVKSLNTYKEALNELIRFGIIVRAVPTDTYWLNPHYFFNGNRITKFPENIKTR